MATPAMASSMSTLHATGAGASTFAVRRPKTAVLASRRRTVVVRASQDKKNSGDGKVDAFSHENSREGKVLDAVSLTGSAPEVERINGRLAMVGFVSALAVEASRGDGILLQASSGSGLAWFAATVAVFSLVSLVPLRKGERPQDRSGGIGGIWTADAEIWNGRVAMLGLVALAATEYMNGTPFISV